MADNLRVTYAATCANCGLKMAFNGREGAKITAEDSSEARERRNLAHWLYTALLQKTEK